MFGEQFYPTPRDLIDRMLAELDFHKIETVLEPSAGKGDIADAVNRKLGSARYKYDNDHRGDVDCIEPEPNLRHILEGKHLRVVHDDFLTYQSRKRYHLIIMNPPFSDGDKHLLKALELQEYGGHIRCLLNAETLRNPYTNTRKALVRKLDEYEAEVEYITGAFENAERRTDVEVALVKVEIPNTLPDSIILDDLRRAKEVETIDNEPEALTHGDYLKAIIDRYQFEVDAGVRLIREYALIEPYIKEKIPDKEDNYGDYAILELRIRNEKYADGDIINKYLRLVRLKYWKALFSRKEFVGSLPSNLQSELQGRVNELADYEFSYVNIIEIRLQMSKRTIQSIEDTIIALFDELSGKYSWSEELDNGNVHYFDGWKTNKAWKINKKVILPLWGAVDTWCGKDSINYRARSKISDIVKVLDFLGGANFAEGVESRLESASRVGQTRDIILGHIRCTFYKKGTCHITFSDLDLLAKFNLFGSQRKGWLPPSYGKRAYKDMEAEERTVVDSFEGEASYAKVMENPQYYIVESSELLRLGAAVE